MVYRRPVCRAKQLSFFVNLPPCLIAMEVCSSAHYWARQLESMGLTVKLMAAQYVKPYVESKS